MSGPYGVDPNQQDHQPRRYPPPPPAGWAAAAPKPPRDPNRTVGIIFGALAVVVLLSVGLALLLVNVLGHNESDDKSEIRQQIQGYARDLREGDFASAAKRVCSEDRGDIGVLDGRGGGLDVRVDVVSVRVHGDQATARIRDKTRTSARTSGYGDDAYTDEVNLRRESGQRCIDF